MLMTGYLVGALAGGAVAKGTLGLWSGAVLGSWLGGLLGMTTAGLGVRTPRTPRRPRRRRTETTVSQELREAV